MMTETYTIQDIAGMTGLNERTIRSYLADGLLKGEKTDGAWRFTAEQFGDFLRQDMVRASVQAKANAVVYDFLITDRRKESAACLILDQPSAEDQEPGLREALSELWLMLVELSPGRAGRAAGPDEKLTQKHRKAP